MTQIDELFVQIAKFVLKNADFSLLRAQTMIKQHTEKLSQIGDIGFPTTMQPWLNIVKNPHDLKDLKQIINDTEDEFARKLIEISSEWMFPIQTVQFKQFRCSLFLDRPRSYSGILKTVLSDNALYGQLQRTNDTQNIYAVQLVKQTNDNSLVEHRCMLIAKVLVNILKMAGIETRLTTANHGCDAKSLVEVLVTSARRDGAKRQIRQNDIEMNNNIKSRLIVCGSVTNQSGNTADEIIRYVFLSILSFYSSIQINNESQLIGK